MRTIVACLTLLAVLVPTAFAAAPTDRGTTAAPFDPIAGMRQAADQFDAKEFDRAIATASRVISSPAAEGKVVGLALFTRASAHFQNGNFESAITDYGEALTYEAPRAGMVHLYRAMAYESTGDLENAARDYSAALTNMPDDPWINLHVWRFFNEP